MATHSSILAWRIPWTEKPGELSLNFPMISSLVESLPQCSFCCNPQLLLCILITVILRSEEREATCHLMIIVVKLLSHVQLFVIPWAVVYQASLSLSISWSLPNFTSIKWVMLSNHLILCCSLVLFCFFPTIFPSIRVFSNELVLCISWPRYLTIRSYN